MSEDPSGGTLLLIAAVVFVALGLLLFLGYMVVGAVFEGLGHDFGSRTGLSLALLVGGAVLGTLVLTVFAPFGTAVLFGVGIGVALAVSAVLISS